VVCDDDVDVTNLDHMLWAMLTRTDPVESIQFIRGSWDSNADPAIPPEPRKAGDIPHSAALINAYKPWHWREQFPATTPPSPEAAATSGSKVDAIKRLIDHFRGGGLAANSEPRTHMRPPESCHSFSVACRWPRARATVRKS